MIGLIGYNFCADGNALDPTPTDVNNITYTRVQNGIFDHFNVSRDTSFDYSSIVPTDWDVNTLMNADFAGNTSAGNVAQVASGVTSVRVKRRIKGTFDWITIREIPVNTPEDMSFVITDNLNAYNTEYEYAFVPVVGGIEGNYITNTISTKFDGVFICDLDTIYKFYAGVEYGTNERVQKIGVFEPYGRKYPVVVSNGLINYETGSVTGTVLADDYLKTKAMNRIAMVKEQKALKDFLTNKKAKILKDWNGNNYLMLVTGNISTSYENNYGMGIADVSFDWTEIGDSNNQADLYNNGLTEVID